MHSRPLEGLLVIDLGQVYNGPYCSLLLAFMGARVVKVEPPDGEHTRRRVTSLKKGYTYPYLLLNSNKEAITLNLKSEQGRTVLRSLLAKADVLLENFAPGVMERLGFDWPSVRQINPRLIYASSSGYGRTGPYQHFPAMDLTVQAMSGVMDSTGFPDGPPVKAGPAVADFSGGAHILAGILAALLYRERTGQGTLVEVGMLDAVVPTLTSSISAYLETGVPPGRTGNRHGGLALCPYNVYPAADGHVAIFCLTNEHWHALTAVMERPDLPGDPKYASNAARVAAMEAVDRMIEEFTVTCSRASLVEALVGRGVPCSPVQTLAEVVKDSHLRARGLLVDLMHPEVGPVTAFGSPIQFPELPRTPVQPAPALGQHTDRVLSDLLGLSEQEIAQLRREKAI